MRWAKELAYGDYISNELPNDELIGELVREKLIYYPTVTREPFRNQGRISLLLDSGKLAADLGLAADRPRPRPLHAVRQPGDARRPHRASSTRAASRKATHGEPGDYVIEKAFVEK